MPQVSNPPPSRHPEGAQEPHVTRRFPDKRPDLCGHTTRTGKSALRCSHPANRPIPGTLRTSPRTFLSANSAPHTSLGQRPRLPTHKSRSPVGAPHFRTNETNRRDSGSDWHTCGCRNDHPGMSEVSVYCSFSMHYDARNPVARFKQMMMGKPALTGPQATQPNCRT
jgi:hypothetical protein